MSSDNGRIEVNEDIHLSYMQHNDAETFVELLQDKEIHDQTAVLPFPYTLEESKEWIDINQKKVSEGTCMQWAIRKTDGVPIGCIGYQGLSQTHNTFHHRDEIGYWLGKPYWNQGIMTMVVKKVCEIGIERFGLKRIDAPVFAHNLGSIRVLEKCGFHNEGILKKAYYKNGEYIDGKMFVLIA